MRERGARMRGLGDLSSDHVAEEGGERKRGRERAKKREKDEYSRTAG